LTAFADRRAFHLLPLRFEALKAQAEANVDARRRKLAAKLHAEELALQQELVANQVTPEERRAALEKRAVDLVRRREEERVAFAEQMLYRQWREGCDGVRQGDSNLQLRAAVEGRSSQLEEKAAAREAAARALQTPWPPQPAPMITMRMGFVLCSAATLWMLVESNESKLKHETMVIIGYAQLRVLFDLDDAMDESPDPVASLESAAST